MTSERMESAFRITLDRLVQEMHPEGFWEGELSSSALSTATAISALSFTENPADNMAIERGVSWLAKTQNSDGGWGDTMDSPSNLATTLLVIAAFKLAGKEPEQASLSYLTANAGATESDLIAAIQNIYGADRTFAVPILANCALAGMVSWKRAPALPFELAVFPRAWYKLLRLHVVSYALPALIATGLAIHHHAPSRSP
ncbi:MAG: prenyltransferase/squalene oxidase repeat-containing protein, partial [Armatimonadota bacterium]